MNNYTNTYAFRTQRYNKDERHSSLEKYTSHFIERVVCEKELETEQNCNISTPTLLAITAFLSRSPGLLNRGPGGPASLEHVPQSSIFSPTATAQSGAWGPTLLGAGLLYRILSPAHLISNSSVLQLTDFLSSPGLYNNLTSTLLPASVTILHSFNPSTVKVIMFWYSSTGCTSYLHRCISNFDSPAGSEVIIQQIYTEKRWSSNSWILISENSYGKYIGIL